MSAFRSPWARSVLLALFAPYLSGCTVVRPSALDTSVKPAHIVGYTTQAGEKITFARDGAAVSRDTLFAIGAKGQLIIPVDSIRTVSVRETSVQNSVLLAVAVGLAIVAFIALADNTAKSYTVP